MGFHHYEDIDFYDKLYEKYYHEYFNKAYYESYNFEAAEAEAKVNAAKKVNEEKELRDKGW